MLSYHEKKLQRDKYNSNASHSTPTSVTHLNNLNLKSRNFKIMLLKLYDTSHLCGH